MSLLDDGNEIVTIYQEIDGSDSDGNPQRVPSPTGVAVLARVQPVGSGRGGESHTLGQDVTIQYRLRVDRRATVPIGPWAAVSWRGRRFEVLGEPVIHSGSPRTSHVTAMLRRQ